MGKDVVVGLGWFGPVSHVGKSGESVAYTRSVVISRIRERVSSSTLIVSLVRFSVSSPLFASMCGWLERSSKELSPLLRYRRAARL